MKRVTGGIKMGEGEEEEEGKEERGGGVLTVR